MATPTVFGKLMQCFFAKNARLSTFISMQPSCLFCSAELEYARNALAMHMQHNHARDTVFQILYTCFTVKEFVSPKSLDSSRQSREAGNAAADSLRPEGLASRAIMLDYLRIALCTGVVYYHLTSPRPSCGSFMVIGFLVLSGFLLGVMFNRINQLDVEAFYANKARRLLPTLTLALLAGICIMGGHAGWEHLLPQHTSYEWGHLRFSQWINYYDSPMWYMAVEISMLLLAPFFFFLHKRKCGIACFFALAFIVSAIMYSQVTYAANRGDGLYYSSLARCWQFVGGVLAAQMVEKFHFRNHRAFCRVAAAILSLLFLSAMGALMVLQEQTDLNYWNFTFGFDCLSVFFYMALISVFYSCEIQVSRRGARVLALLSLMTYPIYLFHVELKHVLLAFFKQAGITSPYWAVCIMIAVASCLLAWCLVKAEGWIFAKYGRKKVVC